jgi:SAM-dependent methyltransferase
VHEYVTKKIPTLRERFSHVYHAQGVIGVAIAILRRLRKPKARSFELVQHLLAGTSGFEIGGPSRIFAEGGLLPIYPLAHRIDNCNFAAVTLWERDAREGNGFVFSPGKAPGRQWVAEAVDLHVIPDESYDFVLSSHSLEHTANPLKAVAEWRRILKQSGILVLVVPHRDGTFDHRRPVTTLAHLQKDYLEDRGEEDLTHISEVLALHDPSRDPTVHTLSLAERMKQNLELRSMHHHVFDTRLAVDVVEWAGFNISAVEPVLPDHIIVVGQKEFDVRAWKDEIPSPFPSDGHAF